MGREGSLGTRLPQAPATVRKFVRRNGSGGEIVAMMEAAEPRYRHHILAQRGTLLCLTTHRRFFRQRRMRSVFMVVTDVLTHEAFQMTLIEHDDMIEQVPAAVADPALGHAVLPRTAEAVRFG